MTMNIPWSVFQASVLPLLSGSDLFALSHVSKEWRRKLEDLFLILNIHNIGECTRRRVKVCTHDSLFDLLERLCAMEHIGLDDLQTFFPTCRRPEDLLPGSFSMHSMVLWEESVFLHQMQLKQNGNVFISTNRYPVVESSRKSFYQRRRMQMKLERLLPEFKTSRGTLHLAKDSTQAFTISLPTLDGDVLPVSVDKNTTIEQLQAAGECLCGDDEILLLHAGRILTRTPDQTVGEYGLQPSARIHVVKKLRGSESLYFVSYGKRPANSLCA